MFNPLLIPEIRQMLAEKDKDGLTTMLNELHPASIADFAEGLSTDEIWEFLGLAENERQAEIFPFFSARKEKELILGVGRERMSKLLESMPHDDRVDLLKRCDVGTVESLMPLIAKAEREDIRRLLTFPECQAGAVMTTDYATLPPDISVQEALSRIKEQSPDKETIYYIYVIDHQRKLIGCVSLRDLILAEPEDLILAIMREQVVRVSVNQSREEVARTMAKYDFLAIPVVDSHDQLVGIITVDDAIDVLDREAKEDLARQGASEPLMQGYFSTSILTLLGSRVVWLLFLAIAATLTVNVLSVFEETFEKVVTLTLFIPLLIGVGGNTGSQSATTIVRGLATGEIKASDYLQVVTREIRVGFLLGLTLACLGLAVVWFLFGKDMALILSMSIVSVCTLASFVGSTMPMLAIRLDVDPAVVSAPFVTTIVDASGLVVYFCIARVVLGI